MGRYVLITNLWGYKAHKYSVFNTKDWKKNVFVFEHEKVEFDTIEEAKEYIKLFEELCSTYETPELSTQSYKSKISYYRNKDREYIFDNENKRLWGWLLGDREKMELKWGGHKLKEYNNKTNRLELYDILFRGDDEIPRKYQWDSGEYEGWLQFRWGDGKNALNYVEPEKPKKEPKILTNDEIIEEMIDTPWFNTGHFDNSFAEKIEEAFAKKEERELIKKLEDRW